MTHAPGGDALRPGLHAFHLDSGRLATVLGWAGEGGRDPRLGPIHALNPGVPAQACARLGKAGPLASNQDGLCLLGMGHGLALLDLPGEPLTSMLEPLLMVFLGVIIGGIVVCMFLPIFKMSSIVKF